MKKLILGASGATGRRVVEHLVGMGVELRLVVRESADVPQAALPENGVEIVRGNVAELDDAAYDRLVEDCDAVVCCLGHRTTINGLFGKPRSLVYTALRKACEAIERCASGKARVVLMSTVAKAHPTAREHRPAMLRAMLPLLYLLLPPHRDNMKAARYLFRTIGPDNPHIDWVAVRPDALIDDDKVTAYEPFDTMQAAPPTKPPATSRINAAHFMSLLATDDELWRRWRTAFPVVYNA